MKNTPKKARSSQPPKPYSKGWIYVLWMESTEFYKVGWVKYHGNIQRRIAEFQTGNPFSLKCLACFQGSLQDESKLHWSMSTARVGLSEWFEANPNLEKLIAENPYEQ